MAPGQRRKAYRQVVSSPFDAVFPPQLFRGLSVVLMTNVLDEAVLSDQVAPEIDASHWGIEIDFRHLKQTMGFTQLNGRTPETAFNEQRWRLTSFWVLQR